MKIISQTDQDLVLFDGKARSVWAGVIFIAISLIIGSYAINIGNQPLWIGISITVLIIGILIILFAKKYTTSINKNTGEIISTYSSFLTSHGSACKISDVKKIDIFETISVNTNGAAVAAPLVNYQTRIVLNDSSYIAIEKFNRNARTSMIFWQASVTLHDSSRKAKLELGRIISDFIGVPLEETGPGSVYNSAF